MEPQATEQMPKKKRTLKQKKRLEAIIILA
jgi:hypothetical protein